MEIRTPKPEDLEQLTAKDIDILNIPIEDNGEAVINNVSEEEISADLGQPSKTSTEQQGETVSGLRDKIAGYEKDNSKAMTPEMSEQIASFIVNLFDGITSRVLAFFAGDSSVSTYSQPVSEKKKLSEQLSLIMIKFNMSVKIEYVFLMTIIMMYAPAVLKVIDIRRQKKKQKPVEATFVRDLNEMSIKTKEKNPENFSEEKINKTVSDIKDKIEIKRKPGRPTKRVGLTKLK